MVDYIVRFRVLPKDVCHMGEQGRNWTCDLPIRLIALPLHHSCPKCCYLFISPIWDWHSRLELLSDFPLISADTTFGTISRPLWGVILLLCFPVLRLTPDVRKLLIQLRKKCSLTTIKKETAAVHHWQKQSSSRFSLLSPKLYFQRCVSEFIPRRWEECWESNRLKCFWSGYHMTAVFYLTNITILSANNININFYVILPYFSSTCVILIVSWEFIW